MKVKRIHLQFDGVEHDSVIGVRNCRPEKNAPKEDCFFIYDWSLRTRVPLRKIGADREVTSHDLAQQVLETCSKTGYSEMDVQELSELIEVLVY